MNPIKLIWVGTAALGVALLNGERGHASYEAGLEEEHMVHENQWGHTMETMRDYSPHTWMNKIKHTIFNPSLFHPITRPWVHIKSYGELIIKNLIPLGLIITGLSLIFDSSLSGIWDKSKRALGYVGPKLWSGLKIFGGALKEAGQRAWLIIRDNLPSIPTDYKSVLALAAAIGLGIYGLHVFKQRVTGEDLEENMMNYLGPGKH